MIGNIFCSKASIIYHVKEGGNKKRHTGELAEVCSKINFKVKLITTTVRRFIADLLLHHKVFKSALINFSAK